MPKNTTRFHLLDTDGTHIGEATFADDAENYVNVTLHENKDETLLMPRHLMYYIPQVEKIRRLNIATFKITTQ